MQNLSMYLQTVDLVQEEVLKFLKGGFFYRN